MDHYSGQVLSHLQQWGAIIPPVLNLRNLIYPCQVSLQGVLLAIVSAPQDWGTPRQQGGRVVWAFKKRQP